MTTFENLKESLYEVLTSIEACLEIPDYLKTSNRDNAVSEYQYTLHLINNIQSGLSLMKHDVFRKLEEAKNNNSKDLKEDKGKK